MIGSIRVPEVFVSTPQYLEFGFHVWLVSVAGLCDINEGSATSEDRCKSPTSGNMSFRVLFHRRICSRSFALSKPKQRHSESRVKIRTCVWMQAGHWLGRKINVWKALLLLIVFYWNCCSSNRGYAKGVFCQAIKLSGCQFHSASVFRNALFEFITVHLWVFKPIFFHSCMRLSPLCRAQ